MRITSKPTWVERTRSHRPAPARIEPRAAAGKLQVIEKDPEAQLLAAKVPEKIAGAYGAALLGALPEIAQLAALPVEDWRARQLERALEQLYKILGRALALVA